MSASTPPPEPAPADPVRSYELFCLSSLFVVMLVLLIRGYGLWVALPFLVGAAGVAARWRMALPLTLVSLAFLLLDLWRFRGFRAPPSESDPLGDFLLCVGVLGYTAGQYRLQSITRSLMPEDPRLGKPTAKKDTPRFTRPLLDAELPILLMSLPLWAWLAALGWEELPPDWRALGLPREFRRLVYDAELSLPIWRLIVVVWILGLGLVLRSLLLVLLHRGRWGASPEEGALYLQDVLWRETRREQTRMQRWLAWARLREDRRKESS